MRVACVDKEFNTQCQPNVGYCLNHVRFVPVPLLDVAGLVPGAHEGKGMGMAFLNDLNQANALVHVIDVAGATNEKGEPAEPGTYDPLEDIQFLEKELDYWFLDIIKRGWEKFSRSVMSAKQNVVKAIAKQVSGLRVTEDHVTYAIKGLPEDPTKWSEEQMLNLASILRRKAKPMIIAANKCDLPTAKENIKRLQEVYHDYKIIPCAGDAELALKEAAKKELIDYIPGSNTFEIKGDMSNEQKKALEYIKKNVLEIFESTGIQEVLDTVVFDVLQRIAVFPGGVNKLEDQYGHVLPDCFLLPPKSTALNFAFRLHSDIGDAFVKAMNVKTKKVVGKEYVILHRDVIEIMTRK